MSTHPSTGARHPSAFAVDLLGEGDLDFVCTNRQHLGRHREFVPPILIGHRAQSVSVDGHLGTHLDTVKHEKKRARRRRESSVRLGCHCHRCAVRPLQRSECVRVRTTVAAHTTPHERDRVCVCERRAQQSEHRDCNDRTSFSSQMEELSQLSSYSGSPIRPAFCRSVMRSPGTFPWIENCTTQYVRGV